MSTGKQFLSAVFLAYVERGLLSLTAPVAEVLPEFGQRGKGRVTPFHLLTHTSGIMALSPPLPPTDFISNRAVFDYVCKERLETQPGERITYSMIAGHAVLAELILEVDGRHRSLTQLLHEELFQPAGMINTSLGGRADLAARMAPIVARFEEPGLFGPDAIEALNMLYAFEGVEIPAAAYLTTSNDLHRFATMLCRGGEIDGFRLLSPAMLDWCSRDHTGGFSNGLLDYAIDTRNWTSFPVGTGVGFIIRGEKPTHGPFSTFAAPRSFGGWGAGSTCFWVDAQRDLAFSMLTTGVMSDDRHVERTRRLGDMALAAIY
jgi:CubicO group peptidase (beta-lactamase class C family)